VAVSTNKIKFKFGTYEPEFNPPIYPYTTTIERAIEVDYTYDGHIKLFDYGVAYDKRYCDFTLRVNTTDADKMLGDNLAVHEAIFGPYGWEMLQHKAAADLTFEGGTKSDFFPFGPDKGNLGVFTVMMKLPKDKPPIHNFDYVNYKDINLTLYNNGSYPAYSLVSNSTSQGDGRIANTFNIRSSQPHNDITYNNDRNNIVQFTDTNSVRTIVPKCILYNQYNSDSYAISKINLTVDLPKAQRIIQEITTGSYRIALIPISGAVAYQLFGYNPPQITTINSFYCHIIDKEIKITHNNYNNITIPLTLFYRRYY